MSFLPVPELSALPSVPDMPPAMASAASTVPVLRQLRIMKPPPWLVMPPANLKLRLLNSDSWRTATMPVFMQFSMVP